MFTETQLSELFASYPNLTTDEIRHKARQVERKDREEGLNNPFAYLDRALRSMSERQPRSREHPEKPSVPRARGSFREDGYWDERLAVASETETALCEFSDTVVRMRLSPADAVAVLEKLPLVRACYRAGVWVPTDENDSRVGGPIGVMLGLDAKPAPGTPGHDHNALSWLDAAWACTHTSTSAEECVKRRVLFGIAKAKLGAASVRQELLWEA